MAVRRILVPVTGAAEDAAALATGLALARRMQAHVEAFHPAVDSRDAVAFVGEGMTSAMIEQIMSAAEREGQERTARARALFEQMCRDHEAPQATVPAAGGFSAAFVEHRGREDDLIAERGRLADLIIAGKPPGGHDAPPPLVLEAALRETGRPVLIVPEARVERFGTAVAVAWNGSIEVARALAYSLPFLAAAERVVVLSLEDGSLYGPPAAGAVEYLAWHGIAATSARLPAGERSEGETLLEAAAGQGADLMVQGAYTRSHMRRLIFGGVTGEVLAKTTIPVLMTH